MEALVETAKLFKSCGMEDAAVVETLQKHLGSPASRTGKDQRTYRQHAVLSVLETSHKIVDSVDSDSTFLALLELVLKSYELLECENLLDDKTLKYDRFTVMQLLYHFVSKSFKKGYLICSLPVVILLQDQLRLIVINSGKDHLEDSRLIAISDAMFSALYNLGLQNSDGGHENYLDRLKLVLESIPFKSMVGKPGSTPWSERLCRIIHKAESAEQKEVPSLHLCGAVVKILQKCSNLTLKDVFAVNRQLIETTTQMSDHVDQLMALPDEFDAIWMTFLKDNHSFVASATAINSVLRVQFLLRMFSSTSSTASDSIVKILKQNVEIRQKIQPPIKTGPVKLDFNGEIEETRPEESGTPVVDETFSRKDEERLLAPVVQSLALLIRNFTAWIAGGCIINITDIVVDEILILLLECIDVFRLHRMYYRELEGARFAWKFMSAHQSTVNKGTAFLVGTSCIRALKAFRLYSAAIELVELTSKIAGKDKTTFMFEYGLFAVESAWILLLTGQIKDAKGTLSCLKAICREVCLNDSARGLLNSHHLHLSAHFCFAQGESFTGSPLALLEQAKAEIVAVLISVKSTEKYDSESASLYLTICEDLTKFLLRIGGPAEASVYAQTGLIHAKQECASRWIIVFTSLVAHCYQGRGRWLECRSFLDQLDDMLLGRNPSILKSLFRKSSEQPNLARKTGKVDNIQLLSDATKKLTLKEEKDREEESDSEEISGRVIGMVELPCLKAGHKCKRQPCSECTDYDLHVSLLESGCQKYRLASTQRNGTREKIFKDCSVIYVKMKEMLRWTFELIKDRQATAIVGLRECIDQKQILSFLAVPFYWMRLLNIAVGFSGFTEALKMNTIMEHITFEDYKILHPDLIAYARYLEALNLLVHEARLRNSARTQFMQLLKERWHMMADRDCDDVPDGEIINDRLTALFPATPLRSKVSKAQKSEKPAHHSPDREGNPSKDVLVCGPGPKKKAPKGRNPRIENLSHAPPMPSDLGIEFAEQSRVFRQRRETIVQEQLQSSDERHVVARRPVRKLPVSDSICQALTLLKTSLVNMANFPLYPYSRMTSLLLLLLTDEDDGQEVLADLAVKATTGKIHHLALQFHNRLLNGAPQDEMRQLRQDAERLRFCDQPASLDVDELPDGWVVCCINCVTQLTLPVLVSSKPQISHIVVTRWERSCSPITIRLDVASQGEQSLLGGLAEILQSSEKNQNHPKTDARGYWKQRLILNSEMEQLTTDMDLVLSYLKPLLITCPTGQEHRGYSEKSVQALQDVAKTCNTDVADHILRILIMSGASVLVDSELTTLISILLRKAETSSVVTEFFSILRKLRSTKDYKSLVAAARNPLILVLDSEMHSLPWESIPTLRRQPVSRLPSVHFVNLHLARYREELSRNHGFYVLDPTGDLKGVQKDFPPRFFQRPKGCWDGVVGVAPTAKQVKSAFRERELIIYMGHGSGSQVFGATLQNDQLTTANLMLVGCSSAKLEYSSMMDASAFFLQCMIIGSQCIVGNLWPVTNGCINKFTKGLLGPLFETSMKSAEEGSKNSDKSFSKLLAETRDTIASNYVVGAAPVIVGLPVNFR